MDETLFWQFIDESRAAGDGCEKHSEQLVQSLLKLTAGQVEEFQAKFNGFMLRANTWDLWAAAYVMNGGASDDGFEYFRAWLIGEGEAFYTKALENPDWLASRDIDASEGVECKSLLYCAAAAYKVLSGEPLPRTRPSGDAANSQPSGVSWTEDDLPERVPELFAKYS